MDMKAIRHENVVELDVRPIQEAKEEPFQAIMGAVESLKENDQFILHATINPVPLIGVLAGRGLKGSAEQMDENHWIVTFIKEM